MRIRYAVPSLTIATALAALAPRVAYAHTIYVGSCNASANSVATITDAINTIAPNGTIKICPGTYYEQLTITRNMTLEGVTSGNSSLVLLLPPSTGLTNNAPDLDGGTPTAAQIAVQGATVSISNVTVDAAGNTVGTNGCAWDIVESSTKMPAAH